MKKQVKQLVTIMLVMAVLLMPVSAFADPSVSETSSVNGGLVTISGTVDSAVFGQEVTVLVVTGGANIGNLAAGDVAYVIQADTSNDAFSVSFTMPLEKRTGTYDVYIGGTDVSTPAEDELVFTTPVPTTPPTIDMGTAKPAVNGANAFYYLMTITLNDGVTTGFNVKHYPSDLATQVEQDATIAKNQDFSIANISGTTVKVISVLKDIPNSEADRSITTKATLSFTLGGNTDSITQTGYTSLNDTRNQ